METPEEVITDDPWTGGGNLDLRAIVSVRRFALSLQVVAREPSRRCKGGVESGEELRIIIALAYHHHPLVKEGDDAFALRLRT